MMSNEILLCCFDPIMEWTSRRRLQPTRIFGSIILDSNEKQQVTNFVVPDSGYLGGPLLPGRLMLSRAVSASGKKGDFKTNKKSI